MSVDSQVMRELASMQRSGFAPSRETSVEVVTLRDLLVTLRPSAGFFKDTKVTFSFHLPEDYPASRIAVRCETQIFHPNIDVSGNVCLNALDDAWSPAMRLETYVVALQFLLLTPGFDDPLNFDVLEDSFAEEVALTNRGAEINGTFYPSIMAEDDEAEPVEDEDDVVVDTEDIVDETETDAVPTLLSMDDASDDESSESDSDSDSDDGYWRARASRVSLSRVSPSRVSTSRVSPSHSRLLGSSVFAPSLFAAPPVSSVSMTTTLAAAAVDMQAKDGGSSMEPPPRPARRVCRRPDAPTAAMDTTRRLMFLRALATESTGSSSGLMPGSPVMRAITPASTPRITVS